MKISESSLKKIIAETIANKMSIFDDSDFDETKYNPYDYKFNGMSDEEFREGFDSEEEAYLTQELINLMYEGESVFKRMRELIENSSEKDNEKIKSYLEKLDSITDIIEKFWS